MKNKNLNRRVFLKASALGATGALITNPAVGHNTSGYFDKRSNEGIIISRKLGKTGLELPVVSFGVMRADNSNLIKAAMSAGIKHFDTAHGYQNGNNEKMLGEVLKNYPRQSFTIATKVRPAEKSKFLKDLDTSLERLKMDYVDILYVHALSSREEVLSKSNIDALQTAKKLGKAKFIGYSTHSNEPETIEAAIESKAYEVILTAYNFKQDHKDLLTKRIKEASKAGIGIVGMKSMAGGKLGKEDKKMHFMAAIKWVLKNPHVHTIIPGITNFNELEENMSVMNNLNLTKDEKAFLSFASLQQGIYCNGCRECIESCRKKLPIPDMMRAYMYAYGYEETKKAKQELLGLAIAENPCVDCSSCTVTCIKGFNIPEKLADISRITNVPDEFLA
jgi:predicted aldo/keto reductase-like oxidoreductase